MVKKWKRKKNSKMSIPTTKFQKSVSWSFQFRSNVIEHNGQKRNIGSAKKIQVQLVDAWLFAFNFAQLFGPFSPVSTLPYQNARAKLKSRGHARIILKKCFVIGRPKSSIENCHKKNWIHKTSSNVDKNEEKISQLVSF